MFDEITMRIRNAPLTKRLVMSFLKECTSEDRILRNVNEIAAFKYLLAEVVDRIGDSFLGDAFRCCYYTWEQGVDNVYATKVGGQPLRPRGASWPRGEDGKELVFVSQFITHSTVDLTETGADYDVVLLFAKQLRRDKLSSYRENSSRLGDDVLLWGDEFVEGWNFKDIISLPSKDEWYERTVATKPYIGTASLSVDYPMADIGDNFQNCILELLGQEIDPVKAWLLAARITNIPVSKMCKFYWGTNKDSWCEGGASGPSGNEFIPIFQYCTLEAYRSPHTLQFHPSRPGDPNTIWSDDICVGGGLSYVISITEGKLEAFYVC